jgi:hypothetical protein
MRWFRRLQVLIVRARALHEARDKVYREKVLV